MYNKSTQKRIEKIFPDYFERFTLPEGAKEEAIKVHRACRSGKCDRDSFLPSFEENGFVLNPLADLADPGQYSLSTFEKPTDVKRFAGVMSDMQVPYQIAVGETNPRHGVVQRTRERTKKRTSHDKYGQLYIDRVLFESYFPVIFTCVNDNKEVFICVCCQNNEKGCKWLIGKTSGLSIVKMLRDEITVRQLLLEYSFGKISVDYTENRYTVTYNNSDWDEDSLYLPKHDSYMYAEDGEFEDEIVYFSSLNSVYYDTEYYKDITKTLGTIRKSMEPITEILTELASPIGNIVVPGITIPSEVISTLEVIGELRINYSMNAEEYRKPEKYESVFCSNFCTSLEGLIIQIRSDDNGYADAA